MKEPHVSPELLFTNSCSRATPFQPWWYVLEHFHARRPIYNLKVLIQDFERTWLHSSTVLIWIKQPYSHCRKSAAKHNVSTSVVGRGDGVLLIQLLFFFDPPNTQSGQLWFHQTTLLSPMQMKNRKSMWAFTLWKEQKGPLWHNGLPTAFQSPLDQ